MKRAFVWFVASLVTLGSVAQATTYTWDGEGGDANWSTDANWAGDPVADPADGDDLSFSGTVNTSTTNDLAAGTDIAGIAFANTGNGEGFNLHGNAIDLTGNITAATPADSLPDGSDAISDGISLDIQLTGADRTITLGGAQSTAGAKPWDRHNLAISGVISDDGSARGLLTAGAGYLYLTASNTYTGGTIIGDGSNAEGALEVLNSEALGTGPISINGNKLRLNNVTLDETISYDAYAGTGAITGLGASNRLSGAVTLNTGCDVRGNSITWAGGITSSANQGFGINGAKHVIESMPVNLGIGNFGLTSCGNSSANALQLNVGSNVWGQTTINFGGYLKLGGSNYMPTNTNVKFGWHVIGSSSGTLDLNGYDQEVASIAIVPQYPGLGGDQNITGGGTLALNLTSGTQEYQGRITDGATPTGLIKNGGGTQILNNLSGTPSDYSGATTINGGGLRVTNTTSFGNNSAVTIASGASLSIVGGSLQMSSLSGGGRFDYLGVVAEPAVEDDFSSDAVSYNSTRMWENQIGGGWITCHDTEWFVTNGVLQNAATTDGGYPEARPAEGALAQVVANVLGGPEVTFSFDYDVAAGDTLYANFWGYTGVVSGVNKMLLNTEPCDGWCYNLDTNTSPGNSTLDAFNLKDGGSNFHASPATSISGALTNSGSCTVTVSIPELGISGVSSLADFSYIGLIFCKNEDGLAGTTTIDNVLVSTDQTTLIVGGDNTGTTFSGALLEDNGGDPVGVLKVGTNVLSLAGTNVYSGSTTVNGGTLALSGDLPSTNATLSIYNGSTFKVIGGSGESIDVADFVSDGAAGSTLAFELDAAGVGTLNVITGAVALADFALTVDGSAYAGGTGPIVLIDTPDLQSVSTDITISGFDQSRYIASVVQDQGSGEVRLQVDGAGTVFVVR